VKAERIFFINGGAGVGVDITSQMLAFSILRILAGEEELRWYVGTRVSLYAQNNMSSGGGTITSCGSQWGADSLLPGPQAGSSGTIQALLLWARSGWQMWAVFVLVIQQPKCL
jgi:hypothetical protein